MRALVVSLLVVLAGCSTQLESAGVGNDMGGSGAGSGQAPQECFQDTDCVAAGVRCCDCPTFAVPATDPAQLACNDVMCPTASCPDNVRAACDQGTCVLQCAPLACTTSCAEGYAMDANGCLTCECAVVAAPECSIDTDCARVRDDCCGCALGGTDTAVPQGQVAAHEASLMCPANPACPGTDTCAPDLAATCVQGRCELISGALPAGACGRDDLPACPAGQQCTVNASDPATMQGVGVCL